MSDHTGLPDGGEEALLSRQAPSSAAALIIMPPAAPLWMAAGLVMGIGMFLEMCHGTAYGHYVADNLSEKQRDTGVVMQRPHDRPGRRIARPFPG